MWLVLRANPLVEVCAAVLSEVHNCRAAIVLLPHGFSSPQFVVHLMVLGFIFFALFQYFFLPEVRPRLHFSLETLGACAERRYSGCIGRGLWQNFLLTKSVPAGRRGAATCANCIERTPFLWPHGHRYFPASAVRVGRIKAHSQNGKEQCTKSEDTQESHRRLCNPLVSMEVDALQHSLSKTAEPKL